MKRVVVIGIGNPYRRDDGVGPAVINGLRGRLLPGVDLVESDAEPTRLIDAWADVDLAVVVDAVRTRSPRPGAVHRRSLYHPSFGRAAGASSHAVDLGDAVALAGALDLLPRKLLLYAVEVTETGPGHGLSPMVAAAVTDLVDEICEQVTCHPAA